MKKRLLKVLASVFLITGAGFLYIGWLSLTHLAVPCMFRFITGFKCPGCGVTHMMFCFFQGKWREGASYNICLSFFLPVFIIFGIKQTIQYVKTGNKKLSKLENILAWIIVIIFLIFGIVRNIIGI